MLRPRFGVVIDWVEVPADSTTRMKAHWFGGYAKDHKGREIIRTTQVYNAYTWNLSHEYQFTAQRAEKEALLLAAKRPEFIGRLSIVRIKQS